ncbi:MAG: TnpV protein [Clostridia bacterium]|nr:TnpV protein [Clostridia bacterium]
MDRKIPQVAKAECINKVLKAHDPMAWVARMNSIRHRAK